MLCLLVASCGLNIHYHSNKTTAQSAVAEIEAHGSKALAHQADLFFFSGISFAILVPQDQAAFGRC